MPFLLPLFYYFCLKSCFLKHNLFVLIFLNLWRFCMSKKYIDNINFV